MPGLLGIASNRGGSVVGQGFPAMLTAMARGGRLRAESLVDARERWAIGRVHLGVLHAAPQLAADSAIHVLFHGDLDNEQELQKTLAGPGEPPASGAAATIAALFRNQGSKIASTLKGAFCAAIVDT